MSRRKNFHTNAVADIFLQLLKRKRIHKQTYAKDKKHVAIFSYIGIFSDRIRETQFREACSHLGKSGRFSILVRPA